jgi:heterogeneous nuclear ribonucleoprotein A1/A3
MVKDSSNGKGQDEQYRKLFVGALSLQMTEEDLRTFYSQYGTITDCVVMKDPHTRRSRGFGFVTFAAAEEVDKAMNSRPHVIDGKTVDPKRAVPREASQKNEANMSTKRLYVSGVRDDHQEKDFEEYFSKYGVVEKVEIIKDKNTGNYRGFAFISFGDYDPVDKCCLEKHHMILNHRCDVKKALSKEEIARAQQMDRDRAERGNRSRGMDRNGRGMDRSARGGGAGWNDRRRNDTWGGNTGGGFGGYGAPQQQPWGTASYSASYSQPVGTVNTGGWYEPVPVNAQQQPWNQYGDGVGGYGAPGFGGYGAPQQQQSWNPSVLPQQPPWNQQHQPTAPQQSWNQPAPSKQPSWNDPPQHQPIPPQPSWNQKHQPPVPQQDY